MSLQARIEYETAGFDVADAHADPLAQWWQWFHEAEEAGCVEPHAMVVATVREGGEGIRFKAGPGVGMVTKGGLPIPPGEPAINPVPRQMMREAIEVLTPGLELVAGMPFAGSNFLWCDAEGHSSALVLAATGAATRLAQHHLALGDVEGVFWATGQGLLVLSGHEELVALRMRAHAGAGDLAGVRSEWER